MSGSARVAVWRAVHPTAGVRSGMPAWVLEQSDDHVVLDVPVGTIGQTRQGGQVGPCAGYLRPENYGPGYRLAWTVDSKINTADTA